jgi:hypothetical protein
MTITLNTPTSFVTLYTHRTMPAYSDYSLQLISKYSGKNILEDATVTYIEHTNHDDGGWAEVQYIIQDLKANADYSGYYTCKIGGIGAGSGNFLTIEENLCKVKCNVTADEVFVSDNEDNEQIIFYR